MNSPFKLREAIRPCCGMNVEVRPWEHIRNLCNIKRQIRFDEYDDKYVRVLIDCIKVNTDSTLTVIIKGGVPITVDIPT